MTSIFDNKNEINLHKRKHEKDEEGEKLTAKIEAMTKDELFGPDKNSPEDQMALFMKAFPGSKVVEPPKSVFTGLLDTEVVSTPEIATEVRIINENAILAEALEYIKLGRSVIPVGLNKRPLIAWREYQKRLPSKEEIIQWFTQWPKAQLALVTGKISNISVVDVEKEFGDYKALSLPETAVSKTGSGGWHLFYEYVEGVRNRAKIGGKEVDVRGEGGYVLVPPSANENGKYEWLIEKEKLPPFPVQAFGVENVTKKEKTDYSDHEFVDLDYKGINEGSRNDEMTRYAGAILTQVHPNSWENIAWPMIQLANEKNSPPLDENELRNTFDSVARIEKETDQKRFWEFQQEQEKVDKKKRLKKQLDTGEDKIMHIAEVADERREKHKGKRYSTGFVKFDSSMKEGFKEGDYIVVTGMSGQGKTSFGQTLTHNLCTAGTACCWFSWETTVDVLDEKFFNMGLKGTDFYSVFVPRKNTSGDVAWLRAKIEEAVEKFKVKAFFIDMIDYVVPDGTRRSDNETTILKRAATELKILAVDLNVIIVAMAHIRKLPKGQDEPTLQDIANSSGIFQFADHVFSVTRRKELRTKSFSGIKEEVWLNEGIIRLLKNRETGELVREVCQHQNDLFYPSAPTPITNTNTKSAYNAGA